MTAAPPERSQECHLGGGTTATQTYKKNLLNEPDAAARATNTTDIGTHGEAASGQAGKGKAHSPAPPRPYSQGSRQAAEAAATRRWSDDLLDRLRDVPQAFACAIDRIDEELQAAATTAEMRKHGAGVELILRSLGSSTVPQGRHRGAPGNPAAAGVSARRVASSLSAILKPKVEPKELSPEEPPTGDTSASPDEARVLPGALPLAVDSDPDDEPVRPGKSRVEDG